MKINVGFSKTNSIFSKLIMVFMKSDISHCYIRIEDSVLGVPVVIHSDFIGVVIEHADIFDKKNIAIEEYEINSEHLDDSIKSNLRFLGQGYDWMALFGWAWTIIFKRWVKRKIKNITVDPIKLICVDFVLHVLNEAGLTTIPYGFLTPKDLRMWMMENHQNMCWKKIDKLKK